MQEAVKLVTTATNQIVELRVTWNCGKFYTLLEYFVHCLCLSGIMLYKFTLLILQILMLHLKGFIGTNICVQTEFFLKILVACSVEVTDI